MVGTFVLNRLIINTLTVFPVISAGPQINVAPLGIYINVYSLISAAPLNVSLLRTVNIFY